MLEGQSRDLKMWIFEKKQKIAPCS